MAPGGHKPSKSNARVDNRFPADSFATPAISKDGKNGDVDWKGRFNITYHLILIIQDVSIR